MNIRIAISFLLGVCSFIDIKPLNAQGNQPANDCDFNDAFNVVRSRTQFVSDSMEMVAFIPSKYKPAPNCAVPSTTFSDVEFKLQSDRIYGFFSSVENADLYLVVLTASNIPVTPPLDGVYYKAGAALGAGKVVSFSNATAFVTSDLSPGREYNLSIYAANSNCSNGIKYNKTPLYSGEQRPSDEPALNHYFGNLHSHSSYSDGNQDNTSLIPSDDYAFAKDALCMDFLGIAEHNHYSSPNNPGMHLVDYGKGLQQANTFTNNNAGFLALYGMEFGVINNGGHVIVYGVDSLLGWETLVGSPNYNIYVAKYDYSGNSGLFNTINRFKSKHAFGYFAHPEDTDYGNILGVQYQPLADSAVIGSAVENGPAFSDETNYHDYPSTMSYLQYYKRALAKGYHIGPVIDHDNHNLTFGHTARSRLVVLSPSLDKEDFMNAMRSLSFYATHSCTAIMDFKVYGEGMGSQMEHANAPAMVITIADASSTQQPVVKIYKGTDNGAMASLIATGNSGTFAYTDENLADGASAYYFADISIGNSRTISSPVWYHRNDNKVTAIPSYRSDENKGLLILDNPVRTSVLQYRLAEYRYGQEEHIQITDMSGRTFMNVKCINKGSSGTINVGSLPSGNYVLSVLSDKIIYRKKFVKY